MEMSAYGGLGEGDVVGLQGLRTARLPAVKAGRKLKSKFEMLNAKTTLRLGVWNAVRTYARNCKTCSSHSRDEMLQPTHVRCNGEIRHRWSSIVMLAKEWRSYVPLGIAGSKEGRKEGRKEN